jgi:hypothetical protein
MLGAIMPAYKGDRLCLNSKHAGLPNRYAASTKFSDPTEHMVPVPMVRVTPYNLAVESHLRSARSMCLAI